MMPSSPRTPRHSRHSSRVDSFSASPEHRRLSRSSFQDSSNTFRHSLQGEDVSELNELSNVNTSALNGMGNLADELADVFSESEDEESDEYDAYNQSYRPSDRASPQQQDNKLGGPVSGMQDHGHTNSSPTQRGFQEEGGQYDRSEQGPEVDVDSKSMSLSFIARVDAIESLAQRGITSPNGGGDDAVQRLVDGIRDLGSQSAVEGHASRLITAHSALTTHLAHQTRQLHSLTFPLLSPLSPPPDVDTIDELLPLLLSLADNIPQPHTSAFNALSALHSVTSDLILTLNYLSDNLHMSRQTTATATRRLKSAKELVADLRRDDELRVEGERWLARGNWGERLSQRECAGVCGEVMGGFEEVCNDWRERLLAQNTASA